MLGLSHSLNQLRGLIALLGAGLLSGAGATAMAQGVSSDGSLSTTVSRESALNRFTVTGGSPQGGNLFHSFGVFSPGDSSVLFDLTGEAFGLEIDRIFSRVTGTSASEINGSLSILGGNSPDLFLLNPNGIIFGHNAQLNLPGSFVGTTAESIDFADGVSLTTISPQANPLLSISIPTGLQFGSNPGAISVIGTGSNLLPRSIPISAPPLLDPTFPAKGLSVAPGNTLALLGGPIQFDGGEVQSLSIPAPDGSMVPLGGLQLELGSVGAGQVGLAASPLGWTADYSEVERYQDISFSNQSWLNNGGIKPSSITITGKNILGAGGSTISLLNFGSEKNGDITLRASELFQFSGVGPQSSDIENSAFQSGAGGNIDLFANSLALTDGSRLQVSSYSTGNAGDLKVEVNGDISLNGLTDRSNEVLNITGITSANTNQGSAGEIRVTARNITLENGALISAATLGTGASNDVILNVEDSIVVRGLNSYSFVNSNITSSSFGVGKVSGILKINAASLEVLDGGVVLTSTFGTSNAGEIIINASDYIRIAGSSATPREPLFSGIESDAVVGGLALELFVDERLPLTGDAGNISITTPRLELLDQGRISVTNRGGGGAGELNIVAETLSLSSQAQILAETESGFDGDISIAASESILLTGQSNITASSNGNQRGGNITIETQHLVAAPNSNSDILADARADAANSLGGNITINATSILGFNLADPASEQTNDITASSRLGAQADGTIELSQPNVDPVSGITALNNDLSQSDEAPIANACSAPSTSLAFSGRGGLPLGPNNLLHDTLKVAEEDGPINQAIALRNQGFYGESLALLLDEVESSNTAAEPERQAIAFRQLGITHKLLEQHPESRAALEQSLALSQALNQPEQVSATLLSLGNLTRAKDKIEEARGYYQQALEQNPSRTLRHQILANQLSLEAAVGEPVAVQRLAELLQDELAGEIRDPRHLETRLNVAATLLRHRQLALAPSLLTFLGQDLDGAKRVQNPGAIAHALGHLSQFYEQTEQWDLAQQFAQAALNNAQRHQDQFQEYRWAWQLGRVTRSIWEASGDETWRAQSQAAYKISLQALQQLRGDLATVSPALQFSFQQRVEPVYRQYVSLLLATDNRFKTTPSSSDLKQALKTIEALHLAELDNFFKDACLEATPQSIESLDPNAAVLYPIVLDDRMAVILSHKGKLQHHSIPISSQALEATIQAFQQGLVTRSRRSYKQPGEQLYNWLIRPVLAELEAAEIETLVFVPDGPLAKVPMAALSDGEQYLMEQFNVAIAPSLQLLPAQTAQTLNPKVLVAGISKANQGLNSLAYVEQEVESIEAQLPTQSLINEAFTQASLEQALLETQTPIVHIATHGQFSSKAADTFIAAWDERINIEQLHQLLSSRDRNQLSPTELLILSACETAIGDDAAALGLAGVAVRAGARSTLASLWSINDQSTAQLMEEFYQQLAQPGLTKSAALREAQLAMLEHPIYQHPYYWSAFVLMGSWQ